MGFYVGYLILRRLAGRGYGELKPAEVGDFITYCALFGVVLGGRIGYMFLYNFESLKADPLSFLRIWEGGMASHGGILGMLLYTWYYAWRHNRNWLGVCDNLVVAGPIGVFFGRIANFINGELYGRITNVSWAVKFPTEIHDSKFMPASTATVELPWQSFPQYSNEIIQLAERFPGGKDALISILNPRHPSQLYAAVLEGLFLFVVLYAVRVKWKSLHKGIIAGLFFILYAVVRIAGENFREPDASLIMGITRGQFYSLFMVVVGLAYIAAAFYYGKHRAKGDLVR